MVYIQPFLVDNLPILSLPYCGTVNSKAIETFVLPPEPFIVSGNHTCMRVSLTRFFKTVLLPFISVVTDLITYPSVNFAFAYRPPVWVVVAEPREFSL